MIARLVAWLGRQFACADKPDSVFVVPSSGWPGGTLDMSPTQVEATLAEAFNGYYEIAVKSLAEVGVPGQETTR